MAFGVVLFTLLVQGLTMKPLISRMGLIERSEAQKEYERLNARAVMAKSAYKHLESLHNDGLLSSHVWSHLSEPIKNHTAALVDAAAHSLHSHPDVEIQELESAINEVFNIEKATLRTLLRDGIISEGIFSNLLGELDSAFTENQTVLIENLRTKVSRDIQVLMTIVIQEKDVEKITVLLQPYGYPITHIASTGGFLGRKNATLLVGVPAGKQDEIKSLIQESSIERVKTLQESSSSLPEETHSGATIFTLDVKRYQEH
jgi:uncharacterized protein YaaQ